MRNSKLIWCCIAGILLGFIVPLIFKTNQQTSLMIGLVAGLGAGYLLDMMDEKKGSAENQAVLSKKAREANKLMEQARAGLESGKTSGNDAGSEPDEFDEYEDEFADPEEDDPAELSAEEQSARLSEAEEMLRQARERMKK